MRLNYRKDLQCFRVDVFKGLNSLLMLVAIRDGKKGMQHLISILQSIVKSSMKAKVASADIEFTTSGNLEPLFGMLQEVAANSELSLFYVSAFITLLHFFNGEPADDDEPETILLNLIRDLDISQGKLSSLENHGYIKVVSIISSTMLTGMTAASSGPRTSTLRAGYCRAAQFIGTRLFYRMRVLELTPEEEESFWREGGTTGQSTINICGDSALRDHRNLLPQFLLPKLPTNSTAVTSNTEDFTGVDKDGDNDANTDMDMEDANSATHQSVTTLPPKELKKLLRARNLPEYGARPALITRIQDAMRKRKRAQGPGEAPKRDRKKRNYPSEEDTTVDR